MLRRARLGNASLINNVNAYNGRMRNLMKIQKKRAEQDGFATGAEEIKERGRAAGE